MDQWESPQLVHYSFRPQREAPLSFVRTRWCLGSVHQPIKTNAPRIGFSFLPESKGQSDFRYRQGVRALPSFLPRNVSTIFGRPCGSPLSVTPSDVGLLQGSVESRVPVESGHELPMHSGWRCTPSDTNLWKPQYSSVQLLCISLAFPAVLQHHWSRSRVRRCHRSGPGPIPG